MLLRKIQIYKYTHILILVVGLFLGQFALAQSPSHINYQGKLRDQSGGVITGATTIQFSLYTDSTQGDYTDTPQSAGFLVWTEVYDQANGVCAQISPDEDGIFAQQLEPVLLFLNIWIFLIHII